MKKVKLNRGAQSLINRGGGDLLDLVKKARKGDDQAFLQLFQKYEVDIFKMAFVYVKNQHDALDIVQETAYRSFKAIHRLEDAKYFKTWLLKIAINCSLDLIRKQKKEIALESEIKSTGVKEEMSKQSLLKITMEDLMEQLNEEEKTIVLLKYFQDYTIQAIATTVNLPLGTTKTILYRALKKLRKNLDGADYYE